MIQNLRDEDQSDIEHKDRCEASQTANEEQIADLKHSISKTDEEIGRMNDSVADMERQIEECVAAIKETQKEMREMLDERNNEHKLFVKALEDDLKAADIMKQAVEALSAFYKKNKLPIALVQKGPKYSVDSDKAPETSFGSSYSGRSSESGGIISMLGMLIEDTAKEIAVSRADEAEAQKE